MTQHEIEIILARQFAEYIDLAFFIVDPQGNLLYYNEASENILGVLYDETGPMPADEWSTIFEPVDQAGQPLSPDDLPLMIALQQRIPAHSKIWIKSLDQTGQRRIEVTAFPINAQGKRFSGAIAIFWEPQP